MARPVEPSSPVAVQVSAEDHGKVEATVRLAIVAGACVAFTVGLFAVRAAWRNLGAQSPAVSAQVVP